MKPFLLAAALGAVVIGGAATAQTLGTEDVLTQARLVSFKVREGRYDLAPGALVMIEQALKVDPNNPRLLVAYATANFQILTPASAGPDPAAALPVVQRGAAAYEKAFAADPTNASALAGRGATRTLLAVLTQKFELFGPGVADMNKAVEMDPGGSVPRLQRAFFSLNYPKAVRNDVAIEADLRVLIARSTLREGDHLHILLGDLYAEAGRTELAQQEYAASSRPGSTASAMAKTRISSLAAGKVDAAEIASLRSQLGSNCAMCHAR